VGMSLFLTLCLVVLILDVPRLIGNVSIVIIIVVEVVLLMARQNKPSPETRKDSITSSSAASCHTS
jgi:hypothetical protein